MRRTLFEEDHEAFRKVVRAFMQTEVVPHFPDWEKSGYLPRELFTKIGENGVLGMAIPEEYGGGGIVDYSYNVVLQEEAARALVSLVPLGLMLHVVLPYFLTSADEPHRLRWTPMRASGGRRTAVATT